MRFDHVLELYSDATVSVVVGVTLADAWAAARLAWPNIDKSHDESEEACVIDVDGQAIMLLHEDPRLDTFVHEALHVAAWICKSRGMPFSFKNEEGVAYLIEWVVRVAWDAASTWRAPISASTSSVASPSPSPPTLPS